MYDSGCTFGTGRQARQRSTPRYLDEFIITARTGQRDESTPESRRQTFYALIDRMLNEINRRFSSNVQCSDGCSCIKP